TTSTLAAPSSTTSTPPNAGPTKLAVSFTDPSNPPTRVSRSSSSPTMPASTSRCDDEYAGKNAPTAKPTTSTSGQDSTPAQYAIGIRPTRTARIRSEASIIRRGPSTVAARPPQSPRTDMPTNSAASTAPIRVGEPVATRMNQGSATAVISVPVVETTSAANSPPSARTTPG